MNSVDRTSEKQMLQMNIYRGFFNKRFARQSKTTNTKLFPSIDKKINRLSPIIFKLSSASGVVELAIDAIRLVAAIIPTL